MRRVRQRPPKIESGLSRARGGALGVKEFQSLRYSVVTLGSRSERQKRAKVGEDIREHADRRSATIGRLDPGDEGAYRRPNDRCDGLDTVNQAFVVSGEIVIELDRREIAALQGGWHNWRNHTDRPPRSSP